MADEQQGGSGEISDEQSQGASADGQRRQRGRRTSTGNADGQQADGQQADGQRSRGRGRRTSMSAGEQQDGADEQRGQGRRASGVNADGQQAGGQRSRGRGRRTSMSAGEQQDGADEQRGQGRRAPSVSAGEQQGGASDEERDERALRIQRRAEKAEEQARRKAEEQAAREGRRARQEAGRRRRGMGGSSDPPSSPSSGDDGHSSSSEYDRRRLRPRVGAGRLAERRRAKAAEREDDRMYRVLASLKDTLPSLTLDDWKTWKDRLNIFLCQHQLSEIMLAARKPKGDPGEKADAVGSRTRHFLHGFVLQSVTRDFTVRAEVKAVKFGDVEDLIRALEDVFYSKTMMSETDLLDQLHNAKLEDFKGVYAFGGAIEDLTMRLEQVSGIPVQDRRKTYYYISGLPKDFRFVVAQLKLPANKDVTWRETRAMVEDWVRGNPGMVGSSEVPISRRTRLGPSGHEKAHVTRHDLGDPALGQWGLLAEQAEHPSAISRKATQARSAGKMCYNWQRSAACRFGASCRFEHASIPGSPAQGGSQAVRAGTSGGRVETRSCFKCNKRGHLANACPDKVESANVAVMQEEFKDEFAFVAATGTPTLFFDTDSAGDSSSCPGLVSDDSGNSEDSSSASGSSDGESDEEEGNLESSAPGSPQRLPRYVPPDTVTADQFTRGGTHPAFARLRDEFREGERRDDCKVEASFTVNEQRFASAHSVPEARGPKAAIIDSASSGHIAGTPEAIAMVTHKEAMEGAVTVGGGRKIRYHAVGTLALEGSEVVLVKVRIMPGFGCNLISEGLFLDKGCTVTTDGKTKTMLGPKGDVLFKAARREDSFYAATLRSTNGIHKKESVFVVPSDEPVKPSCNLRARFSGSSDGMPPRLVNEDVSVEVSDEVLREAVMVEVDNHRRNGSFGPAQKLPQGFTAVYTNGFPVIKRSGVCKYRLTVGGDRMRQGEDYNNNSSPVPSVCTVRVLLALAATKGYKVKQGDVTAAFLGTPMGEEEVYVRLNDTFAKAAPESGYKGSYPVHRLLKAVYGLPQASLLFYLRVDKVFREAGCVPLEMDPCMYMVVGRNDVFFLVWVDDIFPVFFA